MSRKLYGSFRIQMSLWDFHILFEVHILSNSQIIRVPLYCIFKKNFCSHVGHFGNGVLSYFTFLRWLMFLNIYICLITVSFAVIPKWFFTLSACMKPTRNGTIMFTTFPGNHSSSEMSNMTELLYDKSHCHFERNKKFMGSTEEKPKLQNIADFFMGTVSTHISFTISLFQKL